MECIYVPYIKLINRYDRMGSNISSYICQIIYAHYNNYYIDYAYQDSFSENRINLKYSDSIIIMGIESYIKNYNKDKIKTYEIELIDKYNFWCTVQVKTVNCIKQDLFSYFYKHLRDNFINIIDEFAISKQYSLPFNPNKTILIHLRLDDLDLNNRIDYSGMVSSYCWSNKLINNDFINNFEKESEYYDMIGFNNYPSVARETFYQQLNVQAPMSDEKIENIINICKQKYPEDEIVIVTSPVGDVTLPYRMIRSNDPSLDLYYLCNCEKLILSRSTFSLCALYLTKATYIWLPIWGHTASTGLTTKYDKNYNINYFD